MCHFIRYFFTWIHECDVPFSDLAEAHAGCCYLNELIVIERKPRSLGVEHHNILIKRAESVRLGIRLQGFIALTNAVGGIFKNICFKR